MLAAVVVVVDGTWRSLAADVECIILGDHDVSSHASSSRSSIRGVDSGDTVLAKLAAAWVGM